MHANKGSDFEELNKIGKLIKQGQTGLHIEFQHSQNYVSMLSFVKMNYLILKKKKKI